MESIEMNNDFFMMTPFLRYYYNKKLFNQLGM